MPDQPRQLLRSMFNAAVAAALPKVRIPAHLPAPPKGKTIVIGAGKASAAMAKAVEDAWPGPLSGLVVTRYGHAEAGLTSARQHLSDFNRNAATVPGSDGGGRAQDWRPPLILGDALEGEAREVGRVMAGIARQVAVQGQPTPPPVVLLSGGETTVTVRGKGRGGRNVEFLLSLAVTLGELPGVFALAADTDGVDGAEEIACAIVAPDTLQRAAQLGINAKERLADNDAHSFFEALGDQVITGPTLTNVNDFRAILILERQERAAS